MKKLPFSIHEIIGALIVALLFLLSAYLSTTYVDEINSFIGSHKISGIFVYIGAATFATVFAPVSATPLIPVASSLWGPFLAGVYSIIGWTIGALIAFWIAKRFGYKVVGKIVKIKEIQKQAKQIPIKNLFWSIVFMRMILPVDVLSYALGLFSNMKVGHYALATVIGITPFAFVFSYAVHFPPYIQILILILVAILVFVGYKQMKKNLGSSNGA